MHNARNIRTEGIPLWSFYMGMGKSAFPGGLSNPFSAILSFLGSERLAYGIIFVELLKILLFGLIFYLYLRLLEFSTYSCLVGGVIASFLGYLILCGSGWYSHTTSSVYFVLLLYAFELFYKKNNPLLFPAAVFFVALDPFRLYIYTVFMFAYVLFRIITDNALGFRESIRFFLKLAGIAAIGVGMSAVFSFDNLLSMIGSPRVSGAVGATGKLLSTPIFEHVSRFQGVTAIMRFFSNDLMGTGSYFNGWYNYLEAPAFYCGLLPLLLVPQIFLLTDKRKRIGFVIFLLLWMIPVIFPFFRYALYAFVGNYYKKGLSLFIPITVLLFGLYGLEQIQKRKKLNNIVLLLTLLILLIVLYFPFFHGTPDATQNLINHDLRTVIIGFLIIYTGILYLLGSERFRLYGKILLLVFVCIELRAFSSITVNDRQAVTREQFESRVGYNDYTKDAIDYIRSKDTGFYRINKVYSSSLAEHPSFNDAMVLGYYGTTSYASFNKQEYIDFLQATGIIKKGNEIQTRWAEGLYRRPLLQAIASVKYNLVKPKYLSARESSNLLKQVYRPVKRFNDVSVLENVFSLPLGLTYDGYLTIQDYAKLSTAQKTLALFQGVVTDSVLPDFDRIGAEDMATIIKNYSSRRLLKKVRRMRADALKMTCFSQKDIKGEINLDKKKLMFFSIPFDEGWKVFDNGKPLSIRKVNIGFIGVILDRGFHHIELKYAPKYLKPGISVSLISLMIYFTMAFLRIYHSKKYKPPF